jgi:hypothetical protein
MHGSSKAAGRREGASPWVTAERPVAFPSAFALPTARAAFLGSSGCRRAGQPWRAASTLIWTSLSQELYGNFYCKIAGLVLQNPPNRAAISMGNAEIHVQRTATVSPAIHTARPSVAYITRIGGRPGAAAHALAGASPRLAPAHRRPSWRVGVAGPGAALAPLATAEGGHGSCKGGCDRRDNFSASMSSLRCWGRVDPAQFS